MKIKEQIIQDIEDIGFERPEIENCFNKKIINKGIENKTVKQIKKEIITEMLSIYFLIPYTSHNVYYVIFWFNKVAL